MEVAVQGGGKGGKQLRTGRPRAQTDDRGEDRGGGHGEDHDGDLLDVSRSEGRGGGGCCCCSADRGADRVVHHDESGLGGRRTAQTAQEDCFEAGDGGLYDHNQPWLDQVCGPDSRLVQVPLPKIDRGQFRSCARTRKKQGTHPGHHKTSKLVNDLTREEGRPCAQKSS